MTDDAWGSQYARKNTGARKGLSYKWDIRAKEQLVAEILQRRLGFKYKLLTHRLSKGKSST